MKKTYSKPIVKIAELNPSDIIMASDMLTNAGTGDAAAILANTHESAELWDFAK